MKTTTIIGGLLLGSAMLSCDRATPTPDSPTPSSEATAAPATTTPPTLAFENPVIEFGDVADYETRNAKAVFQNTGGTPLQVTNVAPTCGCTTVGFDTSRIYAPGETGEIVLEFTPKGSGRQSKIVRVRSTDPTSPVQNVTIKANVLASLEANPRVLMTKRIPMGESSELSTVLTGLRPGTTLEEAPVTGRLAQYVSTRIDPLEPDEQGRPTWRVTATFADDIPWGWQTGNLTIKGTHVDASGTPHPIKMNMAMNGNVSGLLEPSSNMLRLGVLTPGDQIDQTLTLSRTDGQPFECIGAPVVGGGGLGVLRVSVAPLDASRTSWLVTAKGSAPARIGAINGNVFIQTDVPGETQIPLRYGGVVQQRRGNLP